MKIALDMLCGDNAPVAMIEGALAAVNADPTLEVVLVGDKSTAARVIGARQTDRISVCQAEEAISMTDAPSAVMKEKSNSSMAIAARLLKEGKVDAMVSAGNTGALFTAASLVIRRIKGVRRAAIGTILRFDNPVLLLDMGANLDATPDILDLYGRMGSIYVSKMLGIDSPRVALLNNGTEETKGTELYTSAHAIMKHDRAINFVGNCEANMITQNFCDVLVCDGFSGNIALKTLEGASKFILGKVKHVFTDSLPGNIAGLMMKPSMSKLKTDFDPKEYGGAPFLGISKPVIKAHGNSDARAIAVALHQARLYAESGAIRSIAENISQQGNDYNE